MVVWEGGRGAFGGRGEGGGATGGGRISALADVLAKIAAVGLAGGFEAFAVHVEQPAVERAAQAAVLAPAIDQIGPAVRAVAIEQAVASPFVLEQDAILAQPAHPLHP